MPGAVGAIVAARNARRRGGGFSPPPISAADERRQKAAHDEYQRKVKYNKILKKYDLNKTGKLEKEQVVKLLTDEDFSTPKGTAPSEEEVDYIIKCADRMGDGCIERDELADAISSFQSYIKMKPLLTEFMEKFDKSKTGDLNRDEIRQCLLHLNNDKPVSDSEVDMIMKEADVMQDGAISQQELSRALCLWYSYVERKNACCCTIS